MKIILILLVSAYGLAQSQPSQKPPPSSPSGKSDQMAVPIKVDVTKPQEFMASITEDYVYTSDGKRDPFLPVEANSMTGAAAGPIYPLQVYELDQLKLVGIIWDVKQPKAMMMDPAGRGHVVRLNEKLGKNNGYIARIREGEIVIVESYKGLDGRTTYQTRIVKLSSD